MVLRVIENLSLLLSKPSRNVYHGCYLITTNGMAVSRKVLTLPTGLDLIHFTTTNTLSPHQSCNTYLHLKNES
ncbi:Hypothetical predicted protein [Octopus vulgaris]|uniref:Uncharacterized protein n=1 Tax=Octopus vulgaris TaxID=6645 RepID=A0AA36BPE8_OCTVU|nr:Hypothetical predicted protein [Octopus vulgaris]